MSYTDPNPAARWHSGIQMAAHLRIEHKMTWHELRVRFPHRGEDFWLVVRREEKAWKGE